MPRPSTTTHTSIETCIRALPAEPGSYVLLLRISKACVLAIGPREEMPFRAGLYAYSGSAFGPGGLRARVGRHLRGSGRRHWHIDALREHASVCSVYYVTGAPSMECVWSQIAATLPGAHIPMTGFGASDCISGCPAHLIALPESITPAQLQEVLSQACSLKVTFLDLACDTKSPSELRGSIDRITRTPLGATRH